MILPIDNNVSVTGDVVQRLGEIDRSLEVGRDLLVVRNDEINAREAAALNQGKGPDRVIISPGPCTPKEAGCSAEIIGAFAGKVPVLGVCLGHQTMADMEGMTVTRHVVPMHGKTSLIHHDGRGIFAGLSNPFEATRYHSLVVLPETIPEVVPGKDGYEVSAWAEETDEVTGKPRRVVMGLRRVWAEKHKKPLEGVQFHPESFLTLEGPKLLANFLGM